MPDLQSDQDTVSNFLSNYMAAQPQQANPFAMPQPAPAPPGNPLFTALSQQAPPAAAPTAPAAPVDVPDAPAPAPKIVAPSSVAPALKIPYPTLGQSPEDKAAAVASQKAADVEASKPGLDTLWGKTGNISNPFLKALARVGVGGLHVLNAAGSVFAPEVEAQIPGTPWNHQVRVEQAENQAVNAQARATAATKNIADQSKADNDAATANTPDYGTFEVVQTSDGLSSFSSKGPNANTLTPLVDKDGKRIQPPPKEPVGNPDVHVLANGDYGTAVRDPKTGAVSFKVLGHTDPKVETDQTETVGPDGKPHRYLVNKATGAQIADLGQAFVKPSEKDPLAHEMAEDRLADSENTHLTKKWSDRATDADSQLQKVADTLNDLNSKNGAMGQSLGIPKMLTALLSGKSTGIRITQAELSSIGRSRGVGDDVVGFFNRMESGKPLTSHQVMQMNGILREVRDNINKKRDMITDATNSITTAPDRDGRYAADRDGEAKWVNVLREQSGSNDNDVIHNGKQTFKYKGSGDRADLNNYTEVK